MPAREHFTNARSAFLATGIGLMLAALSLQAQAWPHWIMIGALYGSGLVLFAASAFFIAKSYYAPESVREPILTICALVPVSVILADMKWRQQHDGVDAVSAIIMNLPSESPSRGGRANRLAVSLQFTSSSDSLYIERAYWLDSLSNCINMSVGSTRHILVGLIDGQTFRVFANRFETDPRKDSENKDVLYRTYPMFLQLSSDLSVKIRVFSTETGKIFGAQSFLIPHQRDIVNAAKRGRE